MTDREFLIWLHERLTEVHGESDLIGHMHRLRCIIRAIPADQTTPNVNSKNSLKELTETL